MIAYCRFEIHIPMASSLKEKRKVIQSLIARCKNNYNVAVAELGQNDLWQRSTIGIVTLGNDRNYLDQQCRKIIEFVEEFAGLQVLNHHLEFFEEGW